MLFNVGFVLSRFCYFKIIIIIIIIHFSSLDLLFSSSAKFSSWECIKNLRSLPSNPFEKNNSCWLESLSEKKNCWSNNKTQTEIKTWNKLSSLWSVIRCRRNDREGKKWKNEKIPLRQNKYKTCQIKQWNHLIDKQALVHICSGRRVQRDEKNLTLSASTVQFPNDWAELIVFSVCPLCLSFYVCFGAAGNWTTGKTHKREWAFFRRVVKIHVCKMKVTFVRHEFLIGPKLFWRHTKSSA